MARLASLRRQVLGDQALTIESCNARESDVRDWLQKTIEAEDRKARGLVEKIIDAMRVFSLRYALETQEVDVSVAAAGDYRSLLKQLRADDLPRFEARINQSLTQIDYNPGRFIVLEAQVTQDVEVRDFQAELRHCLDDTVSGAAEGDQ